MCQDCAFCFYMCLYLEKERKKEAYYLLFFFCNNYFKLKAHLTKGIWMERGFSPN